MTDITELAQLRAELSNPAIGSKDHLRKLALSLVEALEKAQQRISEISDQKSTWVAWAEDASGMVDMLRLRIAELESRTVTVNLPPKIERDYVDGWFSYKGGLVGGGAAEWYNKALDDVGAELTAAGIKVEAE